jgi:hypothetical protein
MIWQVDAFALATGYDDAAHRYIGLWTPEDRGTPPAADSLLIVRPDVAVQQRAVEKAAADTIQLADPDGGNQHPNDAVNAGANIAVGHKVPARDEVSRDGVPAAADYKTRFFGVRTLNPDRYAIDFKNIAEEVITHLRQPGVRLTVRVDIEATDHRGFGEATIRTVSENATTLKFDQSGFEIS